jgi:CBS domain-containing protein
MKVHDVMTTHVHCCSPSTDLAAAAVMMFAGDCGVLPVLLEHKVMGIITDRDIAIALGTRG